MNTDRQSPSASFMNADFGLLERAEQKFKSDDGGTSQQPAGVGPRGDVPPAGIHGYPRGSGDEDGDTG